MMQASATALAAALPVRVNAQAYPAQELRFVNSYPAGSTLDVVARYFADRIRPLAGRPIVVENRPGALGHIATEHVARAKPDGHTIYVTGASTVAANMHLLKDPRMDVTETLQMAATIHRSAFVLAVPASAPWKTLAEFTAAMRKKGGKATYAITNPAAKVMGALYREKAGLQAVEVPYKTARDYLSQLASGEIDYAFESLALTRGGRMRVLAVGSGERMQVAPEFPTMTELGYPMDIRVWTGALVPAATPRPIITQINAWFAEVLATADAKTFLNNTGGGDPWITKPDEGQAHFRQEVKDWAEYVRVAKIEKQ
jgi:tripartite-type tricarboxylate transporter receptor subunit TctC